MKTVAILLAAGESTRFKGSIPKPYVTIAGKSVLTHTLNALSTSREIDRYILVVKHSDVELAHSAINSTDSVLDIEVIPGGASRNESTFLALQATREEDSKILIHDAVRPFVSPRIISDCIRALDEFAACDVTIPTADTIIEFENGFITKIPDRSKLRRGQTPQGFQRQPLLDAYSWAATVDNFNHPDDCSVLLSFAPETQIKCVEGEDTNFKLTTQFDLSIATKVMQSNSNIRDENTTTGEILEGKNVLLIGASSGIGAEIHKELRHCGANVFAASRSLTQTDVRDPESVREALTSCESAFGSIDFVVNCAGALETGPLALMDYDAISTIFNTNIMGALNVYKESLPYLARSGGSILTLGSSSATFGRENQAAYSASKSALLNLTQGFAQEAIEHGVRVNLMSPARTATPLRARHFGNENLNLLLPPSVVAKKAVCLLLTELTGQNFEVAAHES